MQEGGHDDDTVEVILRTILSVSQLSVLRSSSGYVRRASLENLWMFRKYKETCCSEQFLGHCDANRIVDNEQKHLRPMRRCRETCCEIMNENSQIFQIIFN